MHGQSLLMSNTNRYFSVFRGKMVYYWLAHIYHYNLSEKKEEE